MRPAAEITMYGSASYRKNGAIRWARSRMFR